MEKYISRKEVLAEPMDELQAVELGYARPNEDNHEWRQGYHVLYPDGYHSWCPKKQFEESNRCAETFVNRLFIEHEELNKRIKSLKSFMYTEKFNSLEPAQRMCMERQLGAMTSYNSILEERISLVVSNGQCCNEAKESYVLFYEELRAIEEETFKNEIEKEWKAKEKELKDI